MNKPFSIYLDLVRFVAACCVYLYHSNQRLLIEDILPASVYGHSAVVIFFVLSGFVIAYITDTRENNLSTYAASRISRIYSVAVPAIVLTIGLDAIGRQLHPALYAYPFDQFLIRGVASLLMLNEVWFVSITSFSNVPYWSICYEMWYYVAFGLLVFLPRRVGVVAVATLAVVLGPKVVLLAPIWMLGVLLYQWKKLDAISESVAWMLVVGSSLAIVLFHNAEVAELAAAQLKLLIGEKWHTELTFSKFFLSDYLLGSLVFLNFAGMRKVSAKFGFILLTFQKPIRFAAGYTLSLYLLHQPLFLFWAAVIHGDPRGHAYWWGTTTMVVLSVLAVGHFTENRRHGFRNWLQKHFLRMDAKLSNRYVRVE